MSYHKISQGKWEVRWREGSRNRSRVVYGTATDAQRLDTQIKEMKRSGTVGRVAAGRQTLEALATDVWDRRLQRLQPKTRELYAWLLDKYIVARLGHIRIENITVETCEEWILSLERDGVGRESQRKALKLLRSVLQRGVEWGRISQNPAQVVPMPKLPAKTEVVPLSPRECERLRVEMMQHAGDESALLVALMSCAGLRPQEALALTWDHVRENTLLIERSVSQGKVQNRTKTGKSRTVRLLAPLAADLREHYIRRGRPHPSTLVFPMRGRQGAPWTQAKYNNWRKRSFSVALKRAGLSEDTTPYHLRHSFASLLLHEGVNPIMVARQLGHSTAVLLRVYAHVIDELELDSESPATADEAIRAARKGSPTSRQSIRRIA